MNLAVVPVRISKRLKNFGEPGCWLWTGAVQSGGYGNVYYERKYERVHRLVYRLLVGPITEDTLDHLCRVRLCANPLHVEPISRAANVMRGIGGPAMNARKTHCRYGHPYEPRNLQRAKTGWRHCRACSVMRQRKTTNPA